MKKDDKIQIVDHIGVHLWKAEKAYLTVMRNRIRARGFEDLPSTGPTVFPYLKLKGIRIVDLAAQMGVSKQAASQNVKELVRLGYLELGPDPEDRRAKQVYYTEKGLEYLIAGSRIKLEMQREMAELLGAENLERIASDLGKISDYYGSRQEMC